MSPDEIEDRKRASHYWEDPTMTDRACPLAFLMAVAFATGLLWLYAMLVYVPLH
jgi:hypothetical protein